MPNGPSHYHKEGGVLLQTGWQTSFFFWTAFSGVSYSICLSKSCLERFSLKNNLVVKCLKGSSLLSMYLLIGGQMVEKMQEMTLRKDRRARTKLGA